eukprot:Em0015g858a
MCSIWNDKVPNNSIPPPRQWNSRAFQQNFAARSTLFCVDYWKLNAFSTLDLMNGYWFVDVSEEDRQKMAFVTSEGLFEFKARIKLKPKKCYFLRQEVRYLGHIISEEGIDDCQKALRQCLVIALVLAFPEYGQPFVLDTDASNVGIGAVLSQIRGDGSERVVAYASRSLTRQEHQYCVTRRELLAVEFIQHFQHYLLECQFTLRTDHSSIAWIQNFKEPEGQLAHWLERL